MSDFLIQSNDDFVAARVAIEALLHARPGATYKRLTPDGDAEVVYLPQYRVEETEVLDLIRKCDFSTHRVVVWTDLLNPSEKLMRTSSYVGSIASLERMAKALPLQPAEEVLRLKVIDFERDRAQVIAEARTTVREAEAVYRMQSNSNNFELLRAAEVSLHEIEVALKRERLTMEQHHAIARSIRDAQQALGWTPAPDQTEKRLILGAVNEAVQNLENLYQRS